MQLSLFDIYRTPNIGVFLKANDDFVILPNGLAETKVRKLEELLDVEAVRASIAGSRLLGPLAVMNRKGILVSRLASDEEVEHLRRSTGLRVERFPSHYTSVGNLVAASETRAIAPDFLGDKELRAIEEVLEVRVRRMRLGPYYQVGAMLVVTPSGGVVHPVASEDEVRELTHHFGVNIQPATVNGGVPFVASGLVANSRRGVVGSMTKGPELLMLSRALGG